MNEAVRTTAQALPATTQELVKMRRLKSKPTLNDHVEAIFLQIWENEKFRRYRDALYPHEYVEGSEPVDDVMAAQIIRDFAIQHDNASVSKPKLTDIVTALRVVEKRYGLSRKQRRNMLGGEVVGDGDDNNQE